MQPGFHHEAVFYGSEIEYVAALVPELLTTLGAGGTALVAVSEEKTALLRAAVGDSDHVTFVDMARLGRNPARIIPAWREFLATGGGPPLLGIGEPVWPGRSDAELIECRRHESMLNLAFDGGDPWRLLCPYDLHGLSPEVLADARHNHPHVSEGGASRPCEDYRHPPEVLAWDGALPAPATAPAELEFTHDDDLALVRSFVTELGEQAGIGDDRLADLVLAVNELVTNSLRYGGDRGVLRLWREGATLLCEVADRGHIADPLAGRERPPHLDGGGRGLWLVNHLCDLVQLRTSPGGTVIRLHMSAAPSA